MEVTQGSSSVAGQPPHELSCVDSSLAGMCSMASLLLQFPSGYSLVLAWVFTLVVVGVNSVVVVGLSLSNCDVQDPL